MNLIHLELPPEGFQVTRDWQDMSESIRTWSRPVWNAVSGLSTKDRVLFKCGNLSGKLRKSWGKGKSKGTFVFMETENLTFALNFRTNQIKIK